MNETMTRFWCNVGPASQTVDQRYTSIGQCFMFAVQAPGGVLRAEIVLLPNTINEEWGHGGLNAPKWLQDCMLSVKLKWHTNEHVQWPGGKIVKSAD